MIRNPSAFFRTVNAAAALVRQNEHDRAEAAAYAEQTRRIAEIRKALVADGWDWDTANDEAVERVIISRDHTHADEAADAQTQE